MARDREKRKKVEGNKTRVLKHSITVWGLGTREKRFGMLKHPNFFSFGSAKDLFFQLSTDRHDIRFAKPG